MEKKISAYLSIKLKLLSLLAIVFVLLIHSKILNVENYFFFNTFQTVLCDYFCRVFQPLFFSISGYLFFYGFNGRWEDIKKKYNRRIKSLLIPYILWCILFVLQLLILKYLPSIGEYINSNLDFLVTGKWFDILKIIFMNPYAFHLWFIRDLIIIIIFTPLIFYSIKKINFYFVLFLVVLDLIFKISFLSSFVPFAFGACLAIKSINIEKRLHQSIIIVIGLISLGIGIIYYLYSIDVNYYLTWPFLIFLWYGYDYLMFNKFYKLQILLNVSNFTFFIYVFHEPSLNIFKRILLLIPLKNDLTLTLIFILTTFLSFLLSIFIAKFLNKYFNKPYKILVGGR